MRLTRFLWVFVLVLAVSVLPRIASANVISISGLDLNGNNCGEIQLTATVQGTHTAVEFQYQIEDGEWLAIGTASYHPLNGFQIVWDTADTFSWSVRVRARVSPAGIWLNSASVKCFNLFTGPITGIVSPGTGVIPLSTTYTPDSGYVFPTNFPDGIPNYNMGTYRMTSVNLTTPYPGSISLIRTNFAGSGTVDMKFECWPGPGTPGITAIATTQTYTVSTGLQSYPVSWSNIPTGSFVGVNLYTSNYSFYVVWYMYGSGGTQPTSYGDLIYNWGNTGGSWYQYAYYTGPCIEFTLENPYLDYQGIQFGYKDGTSGTAHVIGNATSAGGNSYTINWNSASPLFGSDRAYVGTRVKNRDKWSGWRWQGPYIVVNSTGVTFTTNVGHGKVTIDDKEHDIVHNTTWTLLDTHTVSVPVYLDETAASRRRFDNWFHGGTRTQTFKFLITSPTNYRANYVTQYRLEVTSEQGTISGSSTGWYDANSQLRTYVEAIVFGGSGERFQCVGWTSTGALANGTTNDTGNFQLTEATSIVWNWAKQYYFDVSTPVGTPLGHTSGWYPEGANMVSYVDSPVAIDSQRRWLCTGWTGTGSIGDGDVSYSGEFTLTTNTTIVWNWATQYRLQASTNHGTVLPSTDSWHFVNAVVDVTAYSPGSSAEQRFFWVGWTGTDYGTTPGGDPAMTVTMDKPRQYAANWTAEYYLMAVAQNGSLADEYDGWYPAGTQVSVRAVPPAVEPGVRFVVGWGGSGFPEVPASISAPNPVLVTVNGPVSMFAIWERQYSLQIMNPQGIGLPSPGIGTYWYFSGERVSGWIDYRAQGLVCKGFIGTGSAVTGTLPYFEFTLSEPSTITWMWGSPAMATAAQWATQRKLAQNTGGGLSDIARRADGSPVVVYFSESDNAIKAGRYYGGKWAVDVVHSIDSKVDGEVVPSPGNSLRVALDPSGAPHIVFYDPIAKALKYATFAGAAWAIQVIDDENDPGRYCDIQIGLGNVPHFAYYAANTGTLMHATFIDNVLTRTVVDSQGNVGMFASLALNPRNGMPRIAYYDASEGDLRAAIWNGEQWDIWVVDDEGDVGIECSMGVDPSGAPQIAYQENNGSYSQGLRVAVFESNAWQLFTLDTQNLTGFGVGIVVDESGNGHISYHDFNGLKYAFFNGYVWSTRPLVEGNLTGSTAIALDGSGNPAVLFWNGRDLEYIDSKTNSYTGPIEVDVAQFAADPDVVVSAGGGGCFVATASFGSLSASSVEALTSVRDTLLNSSVCSIEAVSLYYSVSPAIASDLRGSEAIRAFLRTSINGLSR